MVATRGKMKSPGNQAVHWRTCRVVDAGKLMWIGQPDPTLPRLRNQPCDHMNDGLKHSCEKGSCQILRTQNFPHASFLLALFSRMAQRGHDVEEYG